MKILEVAVPQTAHTGRGPRRGHKAWPSLLFKWLVMVSVVHAAAGCGPGRGAGRRRGAHKLTPLVYKQHVPNVSENTIGASGAAEGRITMSDAERFRKLIPNYNADIIYKDEEGTGEDLLMTQRCKDKLNTLAISVMNQWPGVRLRVIEGWDEENVHTPADNLHYEGRAVDVTTSDRDRAKYGMLAKLAVEAGFDWVYYESWNHIHCSVKSESSQAVRSGGCFPGSATVRTPSGTVPLSQVRVGDLIQTGPAGSFSPVLMFLDRDPDGDREFVQVHTRSGRVLELTPQHLMPVSKPVPEHLTNSYRRVVFAADVEIGDLVESADGALDEVVDVRTAHRKGVYAPLTAEGTLVVNDIVVSCYAVVHSHSLAHLVYGPLRILHNFQLGLRRLWENSLKPLTVVSIGKVSSSEIGQSVGVHWYANSLYHVAEYALPSDWLYHD